MKFEAAFKLDLGSEAQLYYDLLIEEDYDFRSKNIVVDVQKASESEVTISIGCDSVIDLKIANSAVIKSLEIIQKTLAVE